MARVAVHGGTTLQLGFGNMVAWLGQCPGAPLRNVSSTVAGLAGGRGDHGMVHRHGRGKAHLRLVTGIAFANPCRHWNVRRSFRHRRGRTVVTGVTRSGAHRVGGGVREDDA